MEKSTDEKIRSILRKEGAIGYTIRRSARARRMRVSVSPDGMCILTLPRWTTKEMGIRFLAHHAKWIISKMTEMKERVTSSSPPHTSALYRSLKSKAELLIQDKITHYNEIYGAPFNCVRVKYQKKRWGSCSRKGNLNFNYRLVFLPERLVDYVIVHELCHLKELNHSAAFWKHVAAALPHYRELKKELRSQLI